MLVPLLLGNLPSLLQLLARSRAPRMQRRLRRTPWLPLLIVALAGLPWLAVSRAAHAQQAPQLQIRVEPRIVARARSQVALPIEIGPVEALPKKGFVSLRGLPPNVTLTVGQSIAAGSWTVSISDLAALKADIPAGLSGKADILISLIALDGRLLARPRTTLVVEQSATPPAANGGPPAEGSPPDRAERRPTSPPAPPPPLAAQTPRAEAKGAGPASRPGGLSAAEKARAERALAQGEQYLARGSIQVARQYFQLAANAGLAVAALRLAATYDPAELQRRNVPGVVPDRDLARKWYERARDLGAREADVPLARLSGK